MNQREAFNTLFNSGKTFDDYKSTVDRDGAIRKMEAHLAACDDCIQEFKPTLQTSNLPLKILVIAESWCGDCANALPVMARLSREQNQWDLKIVKRDENEEIIKKFYLTGGRKKVPVVIFADSDGDEMARWVERPNRSYRVIRELKEKKLSKEDYIAQYKQLPELQAPSLTREIAREFVEVTTRVTDMIDILPSRKD